MDQVMKKKAIIHALTEIECQPIVHDETAIQEYTRVPLAEISSAGAAFSSVMSAIKQILNNKNSLNQGESLYRMIIPKGTHGVVNSVGNIVNEKGVIVSRARFYEVKGATAKTVTKLNPTMMLMSIAISAITKKIDQIEEKQKDIMAFLELKEKALLKGNIAVLQNVFDEYKYNIDNEMYKNNKYIQIQEIKRDAEQSIVFCRDRIEKISAKQSLFHSDSAVKSRMQNIIYNFKDYELAMYIYAFSAFMEVMLLENFEAGYLNNVVKKIELYAEQYKCLYQKCFEKIEGALKTSVQAYVLKGVASINKMIGKGIAKIPKISEGQVDESLIANGEKVDEFSEKRTETTMKSFTKEECLCILPFVENINTINMIYNEPIDILFDNENVYFRLESLNK